MFYIADLMHLPNTTKANDSSPRPWFATALVDLIEYFLPLYEVSIATEGDEDGWIWWSFQRFCDR